MGLNTGAKAVVSNQEGPYKDLAETVQKYARTEYLRPIADHTREAFAEAERFVEKFYAELESGSRGACGAAAATSRAVILDSGCGTGESTLHIARRFPDIPVIGIDKSGERLTKAGNEHQLQNLDPAQGRGDMEARGVNNGRMNREDDTSAIPANAFWVRGELLDFWRLALEQVQKGNWTIPYHALYYPNPWPKQSEATRRFHLHPIFPTFMALGDVIELRTNWEIYAQEFAKAVQVLDATSSGTYSEKRQPSWQIELQAFCPDKPETAFERKYKEARQQLWRVTVKR